MGTTANVKRCVILAYDVATTLVVAVLGSLAIPSTAYAYVDPSVMTYTIQALAGVAVALSAVAGVAFRRTRKAIMNALHIDENAHKTVDATIYRVDEQGNPIYESGSPRDATQEPAKRPNASSAPEKLGWRARLWRAFIASAFTVGTVFIVAPAEMVAANSGSLFFTLGDIWWPLLLIGFAGIAVLALAISAFRGKAFDLVLLLTVAFGICFYLQALFLNVSLPSADGSPLYFGNHKTIIVISSAVWALVIAGAIALFKWRRQLGRNLGLVASTALIIVQSVAVASLFVSPSGIDAATTGSDAESGSADAQMVITREGLFEVAPSNNVVVFVLDAYDVINMNDLLERNPSALDELTGFTYFKNSSGSSVPTRYGLPYLLTGSWPSADQTWEEYISSRYSSSTFIDDMRAQDYALYIYTDSPGLGGTQYLSSRAVNVHTVDSELVHTETTFHPDGALLSAYRMALYRDTPWLAKKPFWFYTDGVNRAAFDTETYEEDPGDGTRAGGNTQYMMDDAAYYQKLKESHLSLYDDGTAGSMHFIHLYGAHQPYTLDANAVRHDDSPTDVDQQCEASILIVSEYLRQMKELGVYDDATIIITADHGYWFWDETIEQSESDGDMAGGPIMLVKPAGTAEESSQPLVVSDTRTGHLDFQATVIDAMGGDASKYGETVFDEHDPQRIRYYYWPTHNGSQDLTIYEYAIDGEVTDWSAWERTGVSWDFNKPASDTLM